MAREAMDPFKVRRRSSMYRVFSADYIDVPSNPTLVKLLTKQGVMAQVIQECYTFKLIFEEFVVHPSGDRQVLFADNVMKLNRKAKLVRRVLIITDIALYILDSTFYRLKHRFALQAIEKLSLSEHSDNFFAVSIPSEYDCLMVSTRKEEIVTVLAEATKKLSDRAEDALQVNYANSFEYYMDAEHVREVHFELVDGGVKTRFVDK